MILKYKPYMLPVLNTYAPRPIFSRLIFELAPTLKAPISLVKLMKKTIRLIAPNFQLHTDVLNLHIFSYIFGTKEKRTICLDRATKI